MGAKIGAPDMTVIDIDGDGSFMMTQTEMATAAEYPHYLQNEAFLFATLEVDWHLTGVCPISELRMLNVSGKGSN